MADLNNRFDDKVSKDRQARGDGQRIKLSSEEVLEIYASRAVPTELTAITLPPLPV